MTSSICVSGKLSHRAEYSRNSQVKALKLQGTEVYAVSFVDGRAGLTLAHLNTSHFHRMPHKFACSTDK